MSKLNFRFHNPNSEENTADYILKVLLEANKIKLEHNLQENLEQINEDSELKYQTTFFQT